MKKFPYALDAVTGEDLWRFETVSTFLPAPELGGGVIYLTSTGEVIVSNNSNEQAALLAFGESHDFPLKSLRFASGLLGFNFTGYE